MGLGISRVNMTSCGAFRRTSSELQDPSTYKRSMVDRDNHDNASAVVDSRNTIQGQKNNSSLPKDVVSSSVPKKDVVNSSLPKKDVVSFSLPNKDVVNEEKKSTYVNNIYQQLDEESEKITDYDGPMFMKSPSFRDFMRPIERPDDSVKNGGKKKGEMSENNKKTEAPDSVCTGEVCTREETKNETPVVNKEAGPGKDKRVHKIFSQYYKPSTVSGGMKNLFHHHPPKHPKPSN